MNSTTRNTEILQPLAVDLLGLQKILNCGRTTATETAAAAEAIITIGRRRLYNVDKIKNYLDSISKGA